MGDQLSFRSRVVSLVINALDQISQRLGVDVRLEGSKLVVTADLTAVTARRGPGRPPKTIAPVPAQATKGKGRPARPAKSALPAAEASTGGKDFSREAVLRLLRANTQGFSVIKLTRALGGNKTSKKEVAAVVKALMRATGDERVEKKSGRVRLKNLERNVGRPKKGAGTSATAAGARAGTRAKKAARNTARKANKNAGREKSKKPASEAKLAALSKAREVLKAIRAKAAKAKQSREKPGAKEAGSKKAAPAKAKTPKKAAGKTGKQAAGNSMKALPESTGEGGQIPRGETRREPAEAVEASAE